LSVWGKKDNQATHERCERIPRGKKKSHNGVNTPLVTRFRNQKKIMKGKVVKQGGGGDWKKGKEETMVPDKPVVPWGGKKKKNPCQKRSFTR